MGKLKGLIGEVISNKMQKTIVVRTMHKTKHATYGRIIKRYNKYKAHDEKNSAKIGDTVRIVPTRPISKEKNYRLLEIIKKSQDLQDELKDESK